MHQWVDSHQWGAIAAIFGIFILFYLDWSHEKLLHGMLRLVAFAGVATTAGLAIWHWNWLGWVALALVAGWAFDIVIEKLNNISRRLDDLEREVREMKN